MATLGNVTSGADLARHVRDSVVLTKWALANGHAEVAAYLMLQSQTGRTMWPGKILCHPPDDIAPLHHNCITRFGVYVITS